MKIFSIVSLLSDINALDKIPNGLSCLSSNRENSASPGLSGSRKKIMILIDHYESY